MSFFVFSWMRLYFGVLALVMITGCESFELQSPEISGADGKAASEDRMVLALVNSQDAALLLEEKARRRGYRLVRKDDLQGLEFVILEFEAPYGLDTATAGEELERLEPHATADENHLYKLQDVRSSSSDLRAFSQAEADFHEGKGKRCFANYTIGMIDGDVAEGAPALQGAQVKIRRFVPAARTVPIDSHGTSVAEILLGEGAFYGQKLYSAVVVDGDKSASTAAALIRSLDWMAKSNVQVINVSLAGPYNKSLDRAVQRLAGKGVVIIAAAGNDGPNASPRYPAAYDDVVAVTAVDIDGGIYARAVQGEHIEFAALGVDLYLGVHGARRFVSGTSYAAPRITKEVAMNAPIDAQYSVKRVRQTLEAKAKDLGPAGRDAIYGHGVVETGPHCTSGQITQRKRSESSL